MNTSIYVGRRAASPEPTARGSDHAGAGGKSRQRSVGMKRSIDTISTHPLHSQEDTEDNRYGNSGYGDSFENKILQVLWDQTALKTAAEHLLQEAQNYLERVRETNSPEVQQSEDFQRWRKTLACNMAKLQRKIDGNLKSDQDFHEDYPPFRVRPQLIKIFAQLEINPDVSKKFETVFHIKLDNVLSCPRFARMPITKVENCLETNFNDDDKQKVWNAHYQAMIQWRDYTKKGTQAPKLTEIFEKVEISPQVSERFKEGFKIDPDDFMACRQFAQLSFTQAKAKCEENGISDYMPILDAWMKAVIAWGHFSGESFPNQ
jgi:predicted transposase YbfD/YdcC